MCSSFLFVYARVLCQFTLCLSIVLLLLLLLLWSTPSLALLPPRFFLPFFPLVSCPDTVSMHDYTPRHCHIQRRRAL